MKKNLILTVVILVGSLSYSIAQEIQTLFKTGRSGGYGAISNKFTTIRGEYANIVEVYGGWYSDRKFLLGFGAAALTNNIPVPLEYRTMPTVDLSYMYGQFGLVTEYVAASDKVMHVVFHLFTGAGFTGQYERYHWDDDDSDFDRSDLDENWFFVAEPGVQVELNVFKWMRFSPGVSYRATLGSDGRGLSDRDLSDISYNATLKFGKF
jgi:hypothetical protein